MINNDPDLHKGFVVHEKGQKVACVEVLKAVYGVLISAFLWHKQFRSDLETQDFAFNPCDSCAANKMLVVN